MGVKQAVAPTKSNPLPIIPCKLPEHKQELIKSYAEALKKAAPTIGDHGLSEGDFWKSGLFQAAVERLRGKTAATGLTKRAFVEAVLDHLKSGGKLKNWVFVGNTHRHDYEIVMASKRVVAIETKGCLDGQNTNVFERPRNADEFMIWSLCQNKGSDPEHNAWSGIHTRISAEIIARQERVDGLVIWDMLCGTEYRPCPKTAGHPERLTEVAGKNFVPPCIYLFPRSIPDVRTNPRPAVWALRERPFLRTLADAFNVRANEVVSVEIHVQSQGENLQRRTLYRRGRNVFRASDWTTVRRRM